MNNHAASNAAKAKKRKKMLRILADVFDYPGKPSRFFVERHYVSKQHGYAAIHALIVTREIDVLRVGTANRLYPAGALDALPIFCEDHSDCVATPALGRECNRRSHEVK